MLVPHDFDGFLAELREFGPWQADLKQMVRASQQLALFDEESE